MPYKDKEKQKEAQRTAMDRLRGSQRGSQNDRVHSEGSHETLLLKDIKSALPQDIIAYIESVGSRYGLIEQRLRRAYKYQVWHEANFINGIHKGSKYRQYARN